jgi:hypothetical protein
MKHLKSYKLFESTEIFGQKEGFSNQHILNDVEDMLLELEDIGITCRMWTNDYRSEIQTTFNGGQKSKSVDRLSRIDIEINFDGILRKDYDFNKGYEARKIVDDVRSRLESYFKENGGRVRVACESSDFLELSINIFK